MFYDSSFKKKPFRDKLTEKEQEDLINSWEPEPLVPVFTKQEEEAAEAQVRKNPNYYPTHQYLINSRGGGGEVPLHCPSVMGGLRHHTQQCLRSVVASKLLVDRLR